MHLSLPFYPSEGYIEIDKGKRKRVMGSLVRTEILAAVDSAAASDSSEEILAKLSYEAQTKLAIEQLDQLRSRRRSRILRAPADQLLLPGFEALHAFYPNSNGVPTPLAELSPKECQANAQRLREEAAEWNVPRQREHGAAKLLEAEQLDRWAMITENEGKRA
jgi:hypothetical protein